MHTVSLKLKDIAYKQRISVKFFVSMLYLLGICHYLVILCCEIGIDDYVSRNVCHLVVFETRLVAVQWKLENGQVKMANILQI